VGRTGEAYLLDRRGLYQTKTLFESAPLQPSGFPYLTPHQGVRTDDLDVRGRTYLCSHVWTVGDQWLLVFRQEKAEAFAPLQQALWTSALITLAALAAVALAAFAISKKLAGFVAKADREKEELHAQLMASSKMAAVGEMAAGVAHELNNPLGIIETLRTWILDLVTEKGLAEGDVPEVMDAATKIGGQVERCRRITHDLLKFSRRVEAERVEVDLNALVREMLQMVEHRAKAENVSLQLEEAALPAIVSSPSQLQQILLNILNNAVDAMEGKGGSVKVRTRALEGAVQIVFKDSGCGIPQENLERIFQPFFTTKPVGKGTGLGLAVCYGSLQQLGGKIEVQSRVGIGTTFTLTLPVHPPTAR
jgi:two-component system NtrC family sensor kinase